MRRALALALLALPALIRAEAPQRFTLPNGLRVVHLEDHDRPLLRARLHLDLLPEDAPPARPEALRLALRMLDRGEVGTLKAAAADEAMENAGIRLVEELGPDGVSWRLVARSRDQDRALGLLGDRVIRAVFDPFTLAAQRVAARQEGERQATTPAMRLRQILEPLPALRPPSAERLQAVTMEDLLAVRARVFRPDRAVLVLQGDLGLEQAKQVVLLTFGTWTAQAAPATAPAVPPPPQGPVRLAMDGLPLRVQAVAAAPPELTPEARALLEQLVPGDPLLAPVDLRIESAGAVATLEGDPAAPASVAALTERLMGRLEALRQRGFSEADLRRARAAWTAGRSLLTLDPEARIDEALAFARGRAALSARMEALTLEALNAALRRWLDPARFRVGAAGPADALKDEAPKAPPKS
ncbi:pitrilysin family protein [Geothrix sp. 21YS21S-4]|uniref:M16 family metallopeptidase n=1 Tax=Geothrix sp. 21YS21S-4 TaxID=3068889 RepID=UPI0027BAC7A5|nr:insulinase family protein [Geothrix sp. 21YS21S-4]